MKYRNTIRWICEYESVSELCIPRNEIAWPRFFQNRIIMFCVLMSVFMYLWAIYIILRSAEDRLREYINPSQIHECRNWKWGRAAFLRIYVSISNFRYSVIISLPKWSFLLLLHFALLMFMACGFNLRSPFNPFTHFIPLSFPTNWSRIFYPWIFVDHMCWEKKFTYLLDSLYGLTYRELLGIFV